VPFKDDSAQNKHAYTINETSLILYSWLSVHLQHWTERWPGAQHQAPLQYPQFCAQLMKAYVAETSCNQLLLIDWLILLRICSSRPISQLSQRSNEPLQYQHYFMSYMSVYMHVNRAPQLPLTMPIALADRLCGPFPLQSDRQFSTSHFRRCDRGEVTCDIAGNE